MNYPFGLNLSYGKYVQTVHCFAYEFNPSSSYVSGQQLLTILEAGNDEKANQLVSIGNKMRRDELIGMATFVFQTNFLGGLCYSKLYCRNKAKLMPLFFNFILNHPETIHVLDIQKHISWEYGGLIDAVAHLSGHYLPAMSELGREHYVDIYNVALLMGYCGSTKRKCQLICDLNVDSNVSDFNSPKYDMVAKVEQMNGGKWWEDMHNLTEEDRIIRKKAVSTAVLMSLDCSEYCTGLQDTLGIVTSILFIVASDKIYNLNPYVTDVLDSLFAMAPFKVHAVVDTNFRGSFEDFVLDTAPLELESPRNISEELRESIKSFLCLDWLMQADELSSRSVIRIMDMLILMPFIAYEMLPLASRICYIYLLKVVDSDFSIQTLTKFLQKLNITENIMSLLLYGGHKCPGAYSVHIHSVKTTERIISLMEEITMMDYLLTDSLLGEEIILHYMCDMYLTGNTFVNDNLLSFMSKCTPEVILNVKCNNLMDFTMLAKVTRAIELERKGIEAKKTNIQGMQKLHLTELGRK